MGHYECKICGAYYDTPCDKKKHKEHENNTHNLFLPDPPKKKPTHGVMCGSPEEPCSCESPASAPLKDVSGEAFSRAETAINRFQSQVKVEHFLDKLPLQIYVTSIATVLSQLDSTESIDYEAIFEISVEAAKEWYKLKHKHETGHGRDNVIKLRGDQ